MYVCFALFLFLGAGRGRGRILTQTLGAVDRYFEDPEADAEEESQEVVDQFFRSAQEQFGDEGLKAKQQRQKLKEQFQGRQKTAGVVELNNW